MKVDDLEPVVEDWINRYSDIFFDYLCKRVKDSTTAKDILQETFIAAWKNSSSFRKESDEKTWLYSILRHKLIDYYRLQARAKTAWSAKFDFFDKEAHWTDEGAPVEWKQADSTLQTKEFYKILFFCKQKLSPLHLHVFTMKYLDDEEASFICKVLQIKPSNYWVIIHRCKVLLRECLQKNWFFKESK